MKKTALNFLFIAILFTSKSFAQLPGEKKGWQPVERREFIMECITTAKASMGEDSARFYCYCMQEKVEAKYPVVEDAGKLTEADFQKPDWQKVINSCLTSLWTTKDRAPFLSVCIVSAKEGGMTEEKSKSYCECMLFKIEIKFPNPADAAILTPELLATPEWKKIIQGCLDF